MYTMCTLSTVSTLFTLCTMDTMYKITKIKADLSDSSSINAAIKQSEPDEVYNLAAQSHVAVSFEVPEYTGNADAIGTLRILEAIRFHNLQKKTKGPKITSQELTLTLSWQIAPFSLLHLRVNPFS